MPKVDVLDMKGKKVSDIELADSVFGIEPNEAIAASRPPEVLRAQPVRPCFRARRCRKGRNPTPCTIPQTRIRMRRSPEASSTPAASSRAVTAFAPRLFRTEIRTDRPNLPRCDS